MLEEEEEEEDGCCPKSLKVPDPSPQEKNPSIALYPELSLCVGIHKKIIPKTTSQNPIIPTQKQQQNKE